MTKAATNKKRILVVDDEPAITRLLKLTLEQRVGYQVHTANSGNDALLAARSFQPHLILMDIMMPQLSGAEVAAQLRLDPLLRNIPVFFLTAAVRKQELGGPCGNIGGRMFVAKPLNVTEVLKIVERALGTPPRPVSCHLQNIAPRHLTATATLHPELA
jgi:CheY-like chemotaxis protein